MCFDKDSPKKYNYGFKVDQEHNKRYELMKDFYRQAKDIQVTLDRFNGVDKTSICFEDLRKFDLNITQQLNSKVSFKKIYDYGDRLIFETIMLKGGEFGWHVHNDCNEKVFVESGLMYDVTTDKTYKENDDCYFLAGQEHEPIALENTFLIVTFTKVRL